MGNGQWAFSSSLRTAACGATNDDDGGETKEATRQIDRPEYYDDERKAWNATETSGNARQCTSLYLSNMCVCVCIVLRRLSSHFFFCFWRPCLSGGLFVVVVVVPEIDAAC